MRSLIIIGALLVQLCAATVSHEGDQIWRVNDSKENLNKVKSLFEQYNLDIWGSDIHRIDVLVGPEVAPIIESKLAEMGVSHQIVIENIQTIIDEQAEIRNNRDKIEPSAVIDLEVYHTLDEINAYINELVVEFDYITIETIGQSLEGRDMLMLKLSTQPNNPNAFWIQCGLHSRDWVTPASCIYGLDFLTQNYGTDPEVTAFLDDQDVYMVVTANPDGYVHSWEVDRLWRKNRRIIENEVCIGIDLNRNYDSNFAGEGSSDDPCSEMYHGASAFSEPETAVLRDVAIQIQQTQNIRTYYDVHNFSQMWLFPYGWTTDPPPDIEDLNIAGDAAVSALFEVFGTVYTYGSITDIHSFASGGSIDWTYETLGIKYSYGAELRDTGEFGVLLPEDQILPTATEFWVGLFAGYNAQV